MESTFKKLNLLKDNPYFLFCLVNCAKLYYHSAQSIHYRDLGYPNLTVYMLSILIPIMIICLIRRLDILAKFSIFGNLLILFCLGTTVYYSLKVNPSMKGMEFFTSFKGIFSFVGLTAFGMSCSGIVVSVETNMAEPHKFGRALAVAMFFIAASVMTIGFFGYSAWGKNCQSPVTIHFPMDLLPTILKCAIAFMLYITHAVNFSVPFSLLFYYLKKCHKPEHHDCVEYIYRVIILACICGIGIVFPSVSKLMSFLGAFCLSFMAFILPVVIRLAVFWDRPGLGKCKWRLLSGVILILLGLVMFGAGSFVSGKALYELFGGDNVK